MDIAKYRELDPTCHIGVRKLVPSSFFFISAWLIFPWCLQLLLGALQETGLKVNRSENNKSNHSFCSVVTLFAQASLIKDEKILELF